MGLELVPQFFGNTVTQYMAQAEQGRLVHAGYYSYDEVLNFLIAYQEDSYIKGWGYSKEEEEQKRREAIANYKEELGAPPQDFSLYFYKTADGLVSIISRQEPPLIKIRKSLQTTLKNDKLDYFYEVLLNQYAIKNFTCFGILPEVSKLLDELAGPQTRPIVPEGYI